MASGGSENRVQISLDLDSSEAASFLHKLAHDDGFRERLSNNPDETLAEHGISIKGLPTDQVELPPKEMVQEVHGHASLLPGGGTRPWFGLPGVGILAASLTTDQ